MFRAVEASVAHLDDVGSSCGEGMLKAEIEIETGIVVALGDEAALGVVDGDERIDVLAEPIADRLEADALPGGDLDGKAVHRRLAESAPERDGQRHLGRHTIARRFARCSHGQIVDEAQKRIAQPVHRRDANAADANRSVGSDSHIEDGTSRRRIPDRRGLDCTRFGGRLDPEAERLCRSPSRQRRTSRRLAAFERRRFQVFDEAPTWQIAGNGPERTSRIRPKTIELTWRGM